MTPELLDQRRWERVAELIACAGGLEPVIMPQSEGGGILIIMQNRAFHFWNFKAAVNVDVSVADSNEPIENRRNCCRFDQLLERTALQVVGEVGSGGWWQNENL